MDKDRLFDAEGMSRRRFLSVMGAAGVTLAGYAFVANAASDAELTTVKEIKPGEDVFAYILTMTPDRNDAADIYQQTCLALLEKQAEYDPRREFFPFPRTYFGQLSHCKSKNTGGRVEDQ